MRNETKLIISKFEAILKEIEKLEINSCTCRIDFYKPYDGTESKYINPLIDGVATYSKVFKEIEDKYSDIFIYRKYAEQNILKYCQHILEIVGEKATSCKADLQEGLVFKSEQLCQSIFSTLFIELTKLMFMLIGYFENIGEYEASKEYSLNIIDEAFKENDEEEFDISKSYKIIIDNIDYIKNILLQKIEEY